VTTNLFAILTRPLKGEDVENILGYKEIEHDLSIPLLPMPTGPGSVSISFWNQPSLIIGKLAGAGIQVYNAAYPKDQRGIIQLNLTDEPKPNVANYLQSLSALLSSARLDKDLFAYELSFSFFRQGALKRFEPPVSPALKGIKDPYLFEFNIYEGDLREGDVRLLPFKQISIQPVTSDLSRIFVTFVYRVLPGEKETLLSAFDDLEKVLSLTVEEQKNEQ